MFVIRYYTQLYPLKLQLKVCRIQNCVFRRFYSNSCNVSSESNVENPEHLKNKRTLRSSFTNPPSKEEIRRYIKEKSNPGKKQFIYNSVLERKKKQEFFEKMYARKSRNNTKFDVEEKENECELPIAIQLSMRIKNNNMPYAQKTANSDIDPETETEPLPQYPFSLYKNIEENKEIKDVEDYDDCGDKRSVESRTSNNLLKKDKISHIAKKIESRRKNDVRRRISELRENLLRDIESVNEEDLEIFWKARYGTPNPSIPPSTIPCNGCGALLHCQDTSVPGYLPCEIFEGATKAQLRSVVCQRCHFLEQHHVALGVNVSPDDYPKLLQKIQQKSALVVLIVDLLDFPCSIWPDLIDVIGKTKSIFVVGNKVDLLPRDSKDYLKKVKKSLENCLNGMGFYEGKNIQHVCLVSALTGYGIEDLITNLQTNWGTKGDVYLIGCTNVGKSSLFNALLQSDYCKSQAVDIIKRATVSAWPGTTINMLKFPIIRPSPKRLYARSLRIKEERKAQKEEERLNQELYKKTKNPKHLTLIGHIGHTFYEPASAFPRGINDPFAMDVTPNPPAISFSGKTFNPEDPDFIDGRWCYDTPGSIHPEQIISLLTLEELQLTLPKELVKPRTFVLKPGYTFFLAGLGRIDYTEGENTIRITVFSSSELPVSILPTDLAEEFYKDNLGTEILKVPFGGPNRLKDFPELMGKQMEVVGIDKNESCGDIILSSAGWVSITPAANEFCKFVAYTPNGRGCYLRKPSLLSLAVALRGEKQKYSPAYKNDNCII